ncbi:MAG TPA: hypothetical protein VMZ66_11885 [Aeromicrobium sp.]|nr:hypothetical protein [Aeromicrobium sp.]
MTRISAISAGLAAALLPLASGIAHDADASVTRLPCWAGYSYSGVASPALAFGVSGTVTMQSPAVVGNGHVAAWIGVGGTGLGPGGSDEWLQGGIAHEAGGTDVLYVEYKQPGDANATFVPLRKVDVGEAHSVVVYERAAHRDSWRVMIDNERIGEPVTLPGSHGRFSPIATAESWDGGVAGSCNRYGFRFSSLAVRSQFGGKWRAFRVSRVLRDPAYRMTLRRSGFSTSSR